MSVKDIVAALAFAFDEDSIIAAMTSLPTPAFFKAMRSVVLRAYLPSDALIFAITASLPRPAPTS